MADLGGAVVSDAANEMLAELRDLGVEARTLDNDTRTVMARRLALFIALADMGVAHGTIADAWGTSPKAVGAALHKYRHQSG